MCIFAMATAATEALLLETRRRSAHINSYIDMIPARFYLGFEAEKVKGVYKTTGTGALDPAQARPTSELVEMEAAASSTSSAVKVAGKDKKKRRSKEPASAENSAEADASGTERFGGKPKGAVSNSNSRTELRQKLEARIAELKEERRKRQSETDKARATEQSARDKSKATARAVERMSHLAGEHIDEGRKAQSKPAKRQRTEEVSDEVEAGRLDFAVKSKDLPFEMDANKRGAKMAKIRQTVREEEKHKRKIAEAEADGRTGDAAALRQERAMENAMKRAQGLKVHDELSKLRKSAKNVDRQHRRSSEKWANRTDTEKEFQKQKQEKRKENLQKRANSKKKNKRLPGFDGKFGDSYMNSK